MFRNFEQYYLPDGAELKPASSDVMPQDENELIEQYFFRYGGMSFGEGLYRVVSSERRLEWNERVEEAFPNFKGQLVCFAYDWLGRAFALNRSKVVNGSRGVIMLEPGTGEALEIPCSLQIFHENELLEYEEDALAVSFYSMWRASGGSVPNMEECVGYKVPLFLGGIDGIENVELSDIDVYWSFMSQTLMQI